MGWDWERGRLWDGIGNGDGFGTGTAVGWAALAVAAELWGRTHRSGTRRVPACPTAAPRRPWLPHCTHCCPTAAPQLPHGADGGPMAAPLQPHGCPTAPIAAPLHPLPPHSCPTVPIAAPLHPLLPHSAHGCPIAAPWRPQLHPQLPHGSHSCPTAPIAAPRRPHSCPTAPIAAPRRPLLPHCTHRCPPAAPPHPHCSSPISRQHSSPMAIYGVHSSPPPHPKPTVEVWGGVVGVIPVRVIPVGVIPSQWLWGAVCPPRPTPRPTQLKAVGALSAVCSPSAPQCNNRAPPNGSHPMGAMGPISPSLQHWGWVPPISPTPWVLWAP